MEIRPLVEQDRDHIRQLVEQRETFSEQEIHVAMELVDEALRYPEKNEYHILCAIKGLHSVAGYICFGPIPMADDCYDLYWIVVHSQYSRQGVGGKLLEQMETVVTGKNARRIYVDTSSSPPYRPARAFYEKYGYRLECVLNDFYRPGDHKMIFMKELAGNV